VYILSSAQPPSTAESSRAELAPIEHGCARALPVLVGDSIVGLELVGGCAACVASLEAAIRTLFGGHGASRGAREGSA
jgi:hypothetical protein